MFNFKKRSPELSPDPLKRTKRDQWTNIIWFILFPIILSSFVELIQRESFIDFFTWLNHSFPSLFLNYLIISLTFFLFYSIIPRIWITSIITSILFIGLSLINFFKINFRGDPFMPWDLALKKEALNIISEIKISFTSTIIFILIALCILIFLSFFIKEKKLCIKSRITIFIFSFLLMIGCFNLIIFNDEVLAHLNIEDKRWNQSQSYDVNGFLTGFMLNTQNIIIKKPLNYNSEAAISFENQKKENQTSNNDSLQTQPNIIMIMNESLSDPTRLPNVDFSTDPMPNINRIRKEGISGNVLVSEYGGGTCNTEFETITGNKTLFLPRGSTPYQQYINSEIPSVPSYLKNLGYNTLAIHPYAKWFWNRDQDYPLLGFDDFFSDEDFVNPEIKGNFISDKTAVERVISSYEENENTSNPFFCFLVTMQNHGGYGEKNYPNFDVIVDAPSLCDYNELLVQNYTQGVYDADAALGILMDYFSTIDEPTMIIMYGDHLPALGADYDIYRKLGYAGQDQLNYEDYVNLYETPFVMWNNYDLSPNNMGLVDASYLGATVLEESDLPLSPYWETLLEERDLLPNQNNFVNVDSDGTIYTTPTEKTSALNQEHWLMEYDILFGNHYFSNDFFYDVF
jgi:phosphoglycerol transferase MdoB-like AlkP superfamily enzyme